MLAVTMALAATPTLMVAAAVGPSLADPAAAFGALEGIENISLSPDGNQAAFVAPGKGRGNTLYTVDAAGVGGPRSIMTSSGDPERIGECGWVSDDRLLCDIRMVRNDAGTPYVTSRMVAVDASGGNLKIVSRREGSNALSTSAYGGSVIDWLANADGSVLVDRVYIPEERIGSNVSSRSEGLGVDRVDTRTLASKRVETPRREASEYIADTNGAVRIMGMTPIAQSGYTKPVVRYSYRRTADAEWEPLGEFNMLTREGFNPYAVDAAQNVVYGFKREGGRQALYTVALDGTQAQTRVYGHPDVDVDGLLRVGRSRRVVGASFATERREAVYFDPELKRIAASLARALPASPLIRFAGASRDESKLLIWAGADVDPGRYYVYDKAKRSLGRLAASREELEGVALAPVKAVTYKAADGTPVPAYLTLPPGSAGKDLPAIVMPHGGPGARDEWGFDWMSQYYAHRGYAVLQPNFRGSSGYGDAWFQKNGFQSWATAIGDVVDAGRWLIAQGIAAPRQLGIVGWSYGGYAALQSAAVAPDLFKAVVAIAPVTDLGQLKADGLRYTSGAMARDFIGSGPHVRAGSPAQNAKAIVAPVMLVHGTLDSNVLIGQSRLMKEKLSDAGRTAELIVYPELDHYLSNATARADMLRRSDAFLRSAAGR